MNQYKDLERMRKYISDMYPEKSWKDKVKNMKGNQVYAIYMQFKKSGMKPIKKVKPVSDVFQPVQMSIFDIHHFDGGICVDFKGELNE